MGDEVDNVEDVGYLQDIISYIFDEKKIVTYKWISCQLKIHVNRAKKLLYTFIRHLSEERLKELKVIYLLGGILQDNKGCRIQVVSEENLQKVKEQFKIITSEHIYSVSLKNCLSDLHDLYSVDGVKNNDIIIRQGAVRCEEAIERGADELTVKRKEVQLSSADDSSKWPTAKPKMSEKPPSAAASMKKKSTNSISAMFSAANNKAKADDASESENKEEETKPGNSSTATVKPLPGKGARKGAKTNSGSRLAAMFSAQSAKLKPTKVVSENVVKEEKETKSEEVKGKELPQKEMPPKSSPKTATDKMPKSKDKTSENSKQKKRKAKNKDDDKKKKRKRIVLMKDSDSSDDDVFGSEDEEDDVDKGRCPSEMMEEDEEIEEVKEAQPDEVNKRCHAHKRVVVDKTYMDEDGYIVSKKVVEFVSCSEEEEEKENEKEKGKQAGSKAPKIQKVSPAKKSPEKKKQATLMSFFKRN